MKIAILGFGREGQSLLEFLRRQSEYKNAEIWVLDKDRNTKTPASVRKNLGENYLKNLGQFDIIFRSPGIPFLLPEIQKAKKAGAEISSPTKLFFELCPAKIIGVTGTKGKGTTSTLLYQILKASGKKVFLAGNIGKPALDILPKLTPNSFVVLELSSFQLQDIQSSPPVAVVLTMFPDHQDIHRDLKEYYDAKTNIARYQKPNDKIFFFEDDKLSRWVAQKSRGKKIAVYLERSRKIDEKNFNLFSRENLSVKGEHNFKNAVMAATVAKSLSVPDKTILKAVRGFRGLEHRLEFVRQIGKISFYNDSASTSPQTTAAAINAFSEEKILIAGGYDKKLDYRPLADALKNSTTKLVILFGQNNKKIHKEIGNGKPDVRVVRDLKSAVRLAYKTARSLTSHFSPLAAILFSPGAASFDMFENYADRGRQFKKLVKRLQ